jgi:hypothetical protein
MALTTGLDVPLPGGIPRKEWDDWHSLVLTDETNRVVSINLVLQHLDLDTDF